MNSFKLLLEDMETSFYDAIGLIYDINAREFPMFKYFSECIKYNVAEGKKIRGLLVISTYKSFCDMGYCDESRMKEAKILAWAVEILQAAFLVLDDLMDNSPLRRGKPSWYKKQESEGLGLISINDGFHLYTCVQQLILNLFKDSKSDEKEICFKLIKLFHETSFRTCMGQGLDIISTIHDNSNSEWIKEMSFEKNKLIMTWKTALYTYYLPIAAGMILANVTNPDTFKKVEEVSIQLGTYFQTQDDYLDVFADPKILGKEGTDISEGKCSWVVCQAIAIANSEQLKVLVLNYGYDDQEKVRIIKDLFIQLGIPAIYEETETKLVDQIKASIEKHFGCESQILKTDAPLMMKESKKSIIELPIAKILQTQLSILFKRSR